MSAKSAIVVVTSINAKQSKWTWDLALVEPADSDAAAPSTTAITHGTLIGRDDASGAEGSAVAYSLREGVRVCIAPTSWLATLPAAALDAEDSVSVSAATVAFLDALCASGVPPSAAVPAELSLNPLLVADKLSPLAAILFGGGAPSTAAAPKAAAAAAAPLSAAAAAEAVGLITVRDKLENKFSFTLSKAGLDKFRKALEQRVVVINMAKIPRNVSAAIDPSSDEGLALLYYYYLLDEFWKFSERQGGGEGGIERSDYEDHHKKSVTVFKVKRPICNGDIAVVSYVGSAHRTMVLLSNADMRRIASVSEALPLALINLSEKKLAVGKESAEGTWILKVTASVVPSSSAADPILAFDVVIKPRSAAESDATHATYTVQLAPLPEEEGDVALPAKVLPLTYTKGSATVVAPTEAELAARYAAKLPAPTATGPVLVDVPKIDVVHKDDVVTVGPKGTASSIRLEPKSVAASQGFNSGPTFNNYFTASVQLTNTAMAASPDGVSREGISSKVTMEYLTNNADADKPEAWAAMESAQVGVVNNGWGGSSFTPIEEDIDVTEVGAALIAFRGAIKITGECGADNAARARAHRSLPQPLTIRVTVTETHSGATHQLVMQQANPPVTYTNVAELRDSFSVAGAEKDKDWRMAVFADDAAADERRYGAVYVEDGNSIILRRSGTYYTYSPDDIQGVAYAAKKAGAEVHELKDLAGGGVKFTALVDLTAEPLPVWYGVRVDVETATSASSKACLIGL